MPHRRRNPEPLARVTGLSVFGDQNRNKHVDLGHARRCRRQALTSSSVLSHPARKPSYQQALPRPANTSPSPYRGFRFRLPLRCTDTPRGPNETRRRRHWTAYLGPALPALTNSSWETGRRRQTFKAPAYTSRSNYRSRRSSLATTSRATLARRRSLPLVISSRCVVSSNRATSVDAGWACRPPTLRSSRLFWLS